MFVEWKMRIGVSSTSFSTIQLLFTSAFDIRLAKPTILDIYSFIESPNLPSSPESCGALCWTGEKEMLALSSSQSWGGGCCRKMMPLSADSDGFSHLRKIMAC